MRQPLAVLLLASSLAAGGCSRAYYVNAQARPPATAPCAAYALVNGGLSSYLPLGGFGESPAADCEQVRPACAAAAEALDGDSIPIRPGTLLRIHNFPLESEGRNQLVPGLATWEYVVPPPAGPLSRRDFFFLSYLLSASFPKGTDGSARPLADLEALGQADPCAGQCQPGDVACTRACKEALAREAVGSLVYYAQRASLDGPSGTPWGSAATMRAWLTPAPAVSAVDGTHLEFVFRGQERVLFSDWNDAYFAAEPPRARSKKHGSSNLYPDSAGTGRALVEVEIPVRLHDEQSSRYVPVYWSIADLESRLGVTVVGLRRRSEFLSQALLGSLGPKASCEKLVAASYDAYTIWLQRRIPWAPKPAGALGAGGFVVVQKPGKGAAATLDAFKRGTLLAPGDVLITAPRRALIDAPAVR
jgi:hypothetical protein